MSITYNTGQAATGSAVTSQPIPALTGVVTGDVILCWVSCSIAGTPTVSDGQGAYTQIGTTSEDTGTGTYSSLFYLAGAVSGSHTVTVGSPGGASSNLDCMAAAYSGASPTAPIDNGNTSASATATTTPTQNVTTVGANELVVSGAVNWSGAALSTPNSGTNRTFVSALGSGWEWQDQPQATAGLASCFFTYVTSASYNMFAVALQTSGGGGPAPSYYLADIVEM